MGGGVINVCYKLLKDWLGTHSVTVVYITGSVTKVLGCKVDVTPASIRTMQRDLSKKPEMTHGEAQEYL